MFNRSAQKKPHSVNHFFNTKNNMSGFTLIEIVVVMVLIAIIAATARFSFDSSSSPTAKKNKALELYENIRFLQEETLFTGQTLGFSIEEFNDFESDSFEAIQYFDIKWLKYIAEQEPVDVEEAEEGENAEDELFDINFTPSVKKTYLKKRIWQAIDENILQTVRIPSYFEAYIEIDGEQQSFTQVAANNEKNENKFAREIVKSEEEASESKVESDEENEKNIKIPIIYFFADGSVTDFKLLLVDKNDETQGFVIQSKNSQEISFDFLSEEL